MSLLEEYIDKTDGFKTPTLKYSIEYICDCIVDCYYHVKTTKAAKLSIHDNKINYMYEPFPYKKLIHLFKSYPFEENDGFIDIGCGKGRVLVEAALHGCCNIYGVDLSEELLVYARENMKKIQKSNHSIKYQLLCMDAKNYIFSPDINKILIYNPFNLKILIRVLKALVYSIESNPRVITLFLEGPESMVVYMKNLKQFRLIAIEDNIHIYQNIIEN